MKAMLYGCFLIVSGIWIAGSHPYPPLGWAIAAVGALMVVSFFVLTLLMLLR